MMKRLMILLCVLLSAAAHALTVNDLWQSGNRYYQQKQYDSAAYCYQQAAAARPDNATVYYNLANSYYRLNKIAPAVLNYERALRINPDMQEAADNLSFTESRIGNRIQPVQDIFFITWWNTITSGNKANSWAVAALISFIAIIAVLLGRVFQERYTMVVSAAYRYPLFCMLCVIVFGIYIIGQRYTS